MWEISTAVYSGNHRRNDISTQESHKLFSVRENRNSIHVSFADDIHLRKHFGWEKKRRAAFDWRAERAQCPSRQLHALLSDEPGQTDTLNLTQVQSSAEAHVASTWTELDRIKEKDPEEQKEFAETRLWVMYRWVLCRWELARLLIFFHQSRVHVCVYLPW